MGEKIFRCTCEGGRTKSVSPAALRTTLSQMGRVGQFASSCSLESPLAAVRQGKDGGAAPQSILDNRPNPIYPWRSSDLLVQRSAGLVLGNVAQNDTNRLDIGARSGIEAIFILAESDDLIDALQDLDGAELDDAMQATNP